VLVEDSEFLSDRPSIQLEGMISSDSELEPDFASGLNLSSDLPKPPAYSDTDDFVAEPEVAPEPQPSNVKDISANSPRKTKERKVRRGTIKERRAEFNLFIATFALESNMQSIRLAHLV
jgi:hypothetical protein